jgi:hypothetical protein
MSQGESSLPLAISGMNAKVCYDGGNHYASQSDIMFFLTSKLM